MAEARIVEAGKRRNIQDLQLEIRDISTFYGEAPALEKVSLSVNSNEIVTVLGSNGAGKTTLLRTLCGMLTPRYGKILFRGESIEGMEPPEIVEKGIASVPEGGKLFGTMTVLDNLLLGSYSLRRRERKKILPTRLQMIFSIFPILKERIRQKAETLSGGERQMLALGRALIASTRFLALDEPSLGLSPLLIGEVMRLLKQISCNMGVSMLLVEQNAKAALKIADYAYILERGRVVFEDTNEEVLKNPAMYSAYLGG